MRAEILVSKNITAQIRKILTSFLTIFLSVTIISCSKFSSKLATNSLATEKQIAITPSSYGRSVYLHEDFATLGTQRAYRGIFQREADQGGLEDWSNSLRNDDSSSWPKLLDSFLDSEEFKTQIEAKQSGRQILDGLYLGFLGRGVDPDGARIFLQMIRQGKLRETVHAIAMSDEFFNGVLGLPHPNQDQVQPAITKIFSGLLVRAPSDSERSSHNDPVTHNGIGGLHQLVDQLIGSSEFKNRKANQLINQVYAGFLQRLPTSNETKRFQSLERKASLKDAVMGVVLNREFFDKL